MIPRTIVKTLVLMLLGISISLHAVVANESLPDELLPYRQEVMPGAATFEPAGGEVKAWQAWSESGSGERGEMLGYVFLTADFPPEEIGYSGPIRVLVGMDYEGVLTGVKVLSYHESYRSIRGDFLSTEQFQPQFRGKSLTDGFEVGRDIDGVSRATITSWATARGIRNAAREVATAYLEDIELSAEEQWADNALSMLGDETWQSLKEDGWVRDMSLPMEDGTTLTLSVAFMGHEALGDVLISSEYYSLAQRAASGRFDEGLLLLVAVAGDSSEPFRQERLSMSQGDRQYDIPRPRFVYAGRGDAGKLESHARYAGAIVLPPGLDITEPFSVHYTAAGGRRMSVEAYEVPELGLALANGEPVLTEEQQRRMAEQGRGALASMVTNADWPGVAIVTVLMILVMAAFFTKRTILRWSALLGTLVYLGFIDGGFLSISHVTNLFRQGPVMLLDDLPVLLLALFTLVTTLLWGRIFCSSLCPFGAVQDVMTRLVPRGWHWRVPQAIHNRALFIKYGILLLIVVVAFAYSEVNVFQYFEPFGTLFYFSPSLLLWIILAAFLIGCVFIPRFYCRYLCPLGAALGVLSLVSPWRIRRVPQCSMCRVCERDCPTGAIRGASIDFKECVRCDICDRRLLDRAGTCRHDMQTITIRMHGAGNA